MDLISRYGHTWDNKDTEDWTGLFMENAAWHYHAAGELKNSIHSQTGRLNFANENSNNLPNRESRPGIFRRIHYSPETLTARYTAKPFSWLLGSRRKNRLPC